MRMSTTTAIITVTPTRRANTEHPRLLAGGVFVYVRTSLDPALGVGTSSPYGPLAVGMARDAEMLRRA